MAIPTVHITGTIVGPDGTAAGGATIAITLIGNGSKTSNGSIAPVVGGPKRVVASQAGAVDFYLIPNDELAPAGSYYKAVYTLADGTSWTEMWSLPADPASVDLGAIPQYVAPAAFPLGGTAQRLAAAVGLPAPDESRRFELWGVPGGTGVPDLAVVCLKTASGGWEWIPMGQGGP